ncbi:FAD-dependent oxidoreductase [Vibrio sp. SS-MA-C1-2]|uniref:oxidoreductase n=1 Tax=Vibrio sp. SS-MA-C1-2 TaxID=2908646 RepID=UPI001F1EBE96|nr:FAD-dependent oxidoreductase [Vibrio sp. SS-MA-C1-2]UJF19947.1 FAD-dependent oxidoreductase [Vibrio sp. SS-MA-C1-2]
MLDKSHGVLFESMHIGKLKLKNRYSMAPMGTLGCVDALGAYNQRGIEYYVERAKGGVGLIITGVNMVENDVEAFPLPSLPSPTLNPFSYICSAREMTERVHAHDCKIFAQLTAGWGRSCLPGFIKPESAIAPSKAVNRFDPAIEHRELTTEEVQHYITKFVESAAIAQKAGFDGVEIHAIHEGYLLDQFALEFFNQRTDQYGGSFENRYRFAAEIVQGIKAVCGENFPVSVRYSAKSHMKAVGEGILPGETAKDVGRNIEEGIKAAKYLQDVGFDALNVDAGTYDSWYWNHPPNYFSPGMYQPHCKSVSEVVDIPVIMAGRMENPDLAAKAVNDGVTDGISMGRPLLADPDVVNKIRAGRFDEVRPCLSCHLGCLGRMVEVGNISCAVNPVCGREEEYRLKPVHKIKKVVVIGGGVAGMEAARISAERGHQVILMEKSCELGGNVIPGSQAPFKHDDATLINWFSGELKRKSVDLRLNTEATVEKINAENPDSVIMATGSRPSFPNIQGMTLPNVMIAEDALMNIDVVSGKNITVVGAGLVGSEVALWLAQKGKNVTLVEADDDIIGGPHGTCFANYQMLKELLVDEQVDVKTSTWLESITTSGVNVYPTGEPTHLSLIESEHVIIAMGYQSDRDFYDNFSNQLEANEIYNIGDSQSARTIMTAIWDGYEVARSL